MSKQPTLVGTGGDTKHRLSKKTVVLALVCVIVLSAIGIALVLVQNGQHTASQSRELTETEVAIQSAEKQAAKDLPGAKAKLRTVIDSTKDTAAKAKYYKGLGNLCGQYGDYTCALESYKAADTIIGQDYISAFYEGYYQEKLDNKDSARQNYEKAKELIKSIKDPIFDPAEIDAALQRVGEQ